MPDFLEVCIDCLYALSWILIIVKLLNSGFFLSKNIVSSNQAINIYSKKVENRHVQCGNPTSSGKECNKCSCMASPKGMYGKSFGDDN